MAKKYPSAPPRAKSYKRVKAHNKTGSAKLKGFDIKKIYAKKRK